MLANNTMPPNEVQQDSSHSSDNTSEATVVPSDRGDPRNRPTQCPAPSSGHVVSSRPKSSTGLKFSPVEFANDGEAVVVTDLEEEGTESLTGGGPHGYGNQGEVTHKEYVWSYHDTPAARTIRNEHRQSGTTTSHSVDGDDEPEVT